MAIKRLSNSIVLQLAVLTLELKKKNKDHQQEDSTSGNSPRSEGEGGDTLPKSVSLDSPSFHVEDPSRWLYKANQFFMFYNTLPHHKLILSSFHMESKAMVWFQDLKESGVIVDWEYFVKAFLTRFGSSSYDDLMEALTRLRQTGYVEEYKVEFEALSNRLKKFSEPHKLSYILSGLRDKIRLPV